MTKFRLFGFGSRKAASVIHSLATGRKKAPLFIGGTPANPCRKRVLIVDDDPVFLKATAMKLQSAGFQVATAQEGSEAIALHVHRCLFVPSTIWGRGSGTMKSPRKPRALSLGISSSAMCHDKRSAYGG